MSEYIDKYMERRRQEEMLRSKAEEKNAKALDPLLAFTKGDMSGLSGIRNWWLWFWTVGITDPPNKDMERIGEFKVMTIEWDMSAGAASADVFHDPDRERNWKMIYDAPGRGDHFEEGLDDY